MTVTCRVERGVFLARKARVGQPCSVEASEPRLPLSCCSPFAHISRWLPTLLPLSAYLTTRHGYPGLKALVPASGKRKIEGIQLPYKGTHHFSVPLARTCHVAIHSSKGSWEMYLYSGWPCTQ